MRSKNARNVMQGVSEMDQKLRTPLAENELNAITLVDAAVYNAHDEKIGKISHVYGEGLAADIVIVIGGTLLPGPKPLSLPASELEFSRDDKALIYVRMTLTDNELEQHLKGTPPERR